MKAPSLRLLWVSQHHEPPGLRLPDPTVQEVLRWHHHPPGADPPTLRPDAVVLDLRRTENPESAAQQVVELCRATLAPVVILGGPRSAAFLLEAGTAGEVTFLPAQPGPGPLGARILLVLERHRTMRTLRRGHAAFHTILDDLDFGVLLLTLDGTVEKANPAMREMLEARDGSLEGLSFAELTHPEDRDTLALFAELAAGQRRRYVVRQRLLTRRGRTVWLDLAANRVDGPALGEPFCVLQLVDATREVQTRDWLTETRNQYRNLFLANPIPTYIVDSESLDILDANPAAKESLGQSLEALQRLGLEGLWIQSARDDVAQELLRSTPRIGPIRVRQQHREGELMEGELLAVTIEYRGRPAHLVLVRDLRESLRAEESMTRARKAVAVRDLGEDLARSIKDLGSRLEAALDSLGQTSEPVTPPRLRRLRSLVGEATQLADLAEGAGGGADRSPDPEGDLRTLLVEDDPAVRFVVCEMLESTGHRVVEAATGEEAMRRMSDTEPFSLVVTDVTLPDMRGPDLVRELRRRQPGLRCLVMSGYLDEALTARGLLGADLPFLAKPFTPEEFRAKLREVLERPSAPASP